MKRRNQSFKNLWSSQSEGSVSLSRLKYEIKHLERGSKRVEHLYREIELILRSGVDFKEIREDTELYYALRMSGLDLIELEKGEYRYLGMFIDLQLPANWKDSKFYKFILKAIARIKGDLQIFNYNIRSKIIEKYRFFEPEIFKRYFPEYCLVKAA